MDSERKIKILLADDHPVVRLGIKAFLKDNKNFKLVDEATNGKEAIEKSIYHEPDLILLDLSMPVMNGIEAIPVLRKNHPEIKIIVLSMHDKISYIKEVKRLGANGYILKEAIPMDLTSIINNVMTGKKNHYYQVLNEQTKENLKLNVISLTKRERQILLHIANGYSNKEIGNMLFISPRTVESHRERLMNKLGIKNTAGLVKYAMENDLVELRNN